MYPTVQVPHFTLSCIYAGEIIHKNILDLRLKHDRVRGGGRTGQDITTHDRMTEDCTQYLNRRWGGGYAPVHCCGSVRFRIILASQIRIRINDPVPGSINQSESWETHIKSTQSPEYQIFLKQKLHFCLEHQKFYGAKGFLKICIFTILVGSGSIFFMRPIMDTDPHQAHT